MKNILKIPTAALFGLAIATFTSTSLWAHDIFVDAVGSVKWEANCKRCTQVGPGDRSVEIFVEPGDVIVFRQVSTLSHGIKAVNGEAGKIRKRGEPESPTQIVVELGSGDTKIGPGNSFPPASGTPPVPVEMTRISIKENFEGSLLMDCTEHFGGMTVTLKKE